MLNEAHNEDNWLQDDDRLSLRFADVKVLRRDSHFLACLNEAGVTGWEGYEQAIELADADPLPPEYY
jgi:hypothetical protein